MIEFVIHKTDGNGSARLGTLTTARGTIETPAFMPVGSLGTAEDVAEAVAFLASDRARYTPGHQLMVDGGISFRLKNHLPRKPPPVRM